MGQPYLNDGEKKLLNVLGQHPGLPLKELLSYTQYKRVSSITKKINQFRELGMVMGPVYPVDYGKLCKNPIQRLFCVVEFVQHYETVIEYLKLIEPLVWVYPVLSSHKELLSVGILSSNHKKVKALLQLLKDNSIITDYLVRSRRHKDISDPPDFFGNPVPLLDNVLDSCDMPDLSFGHHDILWNECDIRTLSYLHGGYESIKLIDILKKERNSNKIWKYDQIKSSYKKMSKNKLIKRRYFVNPYPLDQCADFFLFIKTDDIIITQKIMHNFARGGRLYREYTLYGDWGMIGCVCHPQFVLDLMHKLDQIKEITEKELYHLRSFPPGIRYVGEHAEFNYYNVDEQTLEYPYYTFEEKIKEKLDQKD